jgi:hypothetical protein
LNNATGNGLAVNREQAVDRQSAYLGFRAQQMGLLKVKAKYRL